MTHEHEPSEPRQRTFGGMTPKVSFLFGLTTGIAAVSFVGFLAVSVRAFPQSTNGTAKGTVAGATTGDTATNTAQPTAPTNDEPEGDFSKVRPVTADEHILGDKSATLTLVEYSDFQCPFCQRVHPTIKRLLDDYAGKIRLVYRHFPLDSIHPQARPAAVASECVAKLGGNDAFWTFADELFANQSQFGADYFTSSAAKVGVNEKNFTDCMASNDTSAVQRDADEGLAAGVRGTPAIFVGDTLVSGAQPYEYFKSLIDGKL